MSDDAEPITSASSLGGRRPLSRRAVLGGLGVIAAAGATTAYGRPFTAPGLSARSSHLYSQDSLTPSSRHVTACGTR